MTDYSLFSLPEHVWSFIVGHLDETNHKNARLVSRDFRRICSAHVHQLSLMVANAERLSSAFPHLWSLNLTNCPAVSGAQLNGLNRAYPQLQRLTLPMFYPVLPGSIGALTSSLQQLNLDSCSSLMSLPYTLPAMRGLQNLVLTDCQALCELPPGFTALTNLTHLDLSGAGQLSDPMQQVVRLKALRVLKLSEVESVTQEGLQMLSSLQLTELEIALVGFGLPDLTAVAVEALPNSLRSLELYLDNATSEAFRSLSAKTTLTQLNLQIGLGLTGTDVAYLSRLSNLLSLTLRSLNSEEVVEDVHLAPLLSLVHLQSLELFDLPSISDAGVETLAQLPGLQKLRLCRCDCVYGSGLEAHANLIRLRLGCLGHFDDAQLRYLRGLTRLTALTLESCPVSDEGLAEVVCSLNLASLRVADCRNFHGSALMHLARMTGLTSLDLLDCHHLTREGVSGMVSLVRTHSGTGFKVAHTAAHVLKRGGFPMLRASGLPDGWF